MLMIKHTVFMAINKVFIHCFLRCAHVVGRVKGKGQAKIKVKNEGKGYVEGSRLRI